MALNCPNTEPQFVGSSATCNNNRAIWLHQLEEATTQEGSIAYYIHDEFVLRARERESVAVFSSSSKQQ